MTDDCKFIRDLRLRPAVRDLALDVVVRDLRLQPRVVELCDVFPTGELPSNGYTAPDGSYYVSPADGAYYTQP